MPELSELTHFKEVMMDLARKAEQPRPQASYQHFDPWVELERRKQTLRSMGLSSQKYEAEVRKIYSEMEI
jgi:hypothetical protein